MSLVRALDSSGDWTFGKGIQDYKSGSNAIAQNIQTRLSSWLGDCFFDLGAGIDWIGFLGGKDELGLQLSVAAVILNTENVTSLVQLSVSLDPQTRAITMSYQATDVYSNVISNTVQVAI